MASGFAGQQHRGVSGGGAAALPGVDRAFSRTELLTFYALVAACWCRRLLRGHTDAHGAPFVARRELVRRRRAGTVLLVPFFLCVERPAAMFSGIRAGTLLAWCPVSAICTPCPALNFLFPVLVLTFRRGLPAAAGIWRSPFAIGLTIGLAGIPHFLAVQSIALIQMFYAVVGFTIIFGAALEGACWRRAGGAVAAPRLRARKPFWRRKWPSRQVAKCRLANMSPQLHPANAVTAEMIGRRCQAGWRAHYKDMPVDQQRGSHLLDLIGDIPTCRRSRRALNQLSAWIPRRARSPSWWRTRRRRRDDRDSARRPSLEADKRA